MSGALRKTMVYLGLAEDQGRHDYDYDGHYEEHYDDAPAAPVTSIDSHRPVASVVRQHAGPRGEHALLVVADLQHAQAADQHRELRR